MLFARNRSFFASAFRPPHRGNVRDVLRIALPMLLSMSIDTLMTFADRLFLSKVGPDYMNAALAGGSMQVVLMTFFNGVLSYSTAQVAQQLGAGKLGNCPRASAQAFIVAIVCIPLVLLLRPLAYWMFELSGVAEVQLGLQTVYLDLLLYGACFVLFRQVLVCFFSGIAETRIVVLAAFLGMLVNVGLNYLLIFGKGPFPELGIVGAAYGTICGNAVTVLILAAKYFGRGVRLRFGLSFRLHAELLKELLRRGFPSGFEMFFTMLAFNSLILLFQGMSPVVATASAVLFNWDMVAYVPLLGLGVAATSLSGRYSGARDMAAVRRSIRSCILIGVGFSALAAVFFVGLPSVLADVFSPGAGNEVFEEAKPVAVTMLRLASLYVLFEVPLVVLAGALRGAGDTFWVMCALVLCNWFTTGELWFFGYFLGLGAIASWFVVVVSYCLFPVVLYLRFRSGAWRALKRV